MRSLHVMNLCGIFYVIATLKYVKKFREIRLLVQLKAILQKHIVSWFHRIILIPYNGTYFDVILSKLVILDLFTRIASRWKNVELSYKHENIKYKQNVVCQQFTASNKTLQNGFTNWAPLKAGYSIQSWKR